MDLTTCSSFKGKILRAGWNPFGRGKHFGHGAVQVGHRCFIVGGYSRHETSVYVYDVQKETWFQLKPSNHRLAFGRVKAIFTVADLLYAYVWQERGPRNYALVTYDLVEMSDWYVVDAKRSPNLRYGVSGCFVERRGEAVITSPRSHSSPGTVMVYRVAEKSWYQPQVKGAPPLLDMNHSTCSTGSSVFAMGNSGGAPRMCLFLLDVTRLPFVWSMPVGGDYQPCNRYLFQASCTVNRIFVYGGYSGVRSFDVYSIPEKRWLTKFRMDNEWTAGTSENAVVQSSERLLIFGGFELPAHTPLEITAA